MFEEFDFAAFYDLTFKEDAVREEIIAPVLRRVGYRPTGSLRVQRSKTLSHPFVMIGSKKHPVSIIPDYTLFHNDLPLMILDAKKPSEDIVGSVHVEQAYSYAIHPDVRCQIYGLCNGRQWSFFHTGRSAPLFVIATSEIDTRWDEVAKYLSPTILKDPDILDFYADFGIHAYRAGVEEGSLFFFNGFHLQLAMRIDEHLVTANSTYAVNDREHFVSFDFDAPSFERVLSALPGDDRDRVRDALKRNPFCADLEAQISIDCSALLCGAVQGECELFAPFRVVEVSASRYDPTAVRTRHPNGRPSDIPNHVFRLSKH